MSILIQDNQKMIKSMKLIITCLLSSLIFSCATAKEQNKNTPLIPIESVPPPPEDPTNVVKWQRFGKEVVERAVKENKITFIYVGSPSCNVCTKLERTTMRDQCVVDYLNNYFIPVKINLGDTLTSDEDILISQLFPNMTSIEIPSIALIMPNGDVVGKKIIAGFVPADACCSLLEKISKIMKKHTF